MKATFFTTLAMAAATAVAAPAKVSRSSPSKAEVLAADQADCDAYPWFIGPRYVADCSGDEPEYNPTTSNNSAATCQPLADPANPGEQTGPFIAADVTIACGGWVVTLYNSTDCSDVGVNTTAMEQCVPAPDGQQFLMFSAAQLTS